MILKEPLKNTIPRILNRQGHYIQPHHHTSPYITIPTSASLYQSQTSLYHPRRHYTISNIIIPPSTSPYHHLSHHTNCNITIPTPNDHQTAITIPNRSRDLPMTPYDTITRGLACPTRTADRGSKVAAAIGSYVATLQEAELALDYGPVILQHPATDAYSFFRSRNPDRKESLVIKPQGKIQTVFKSDSFFVSCSSDADNVQRVMWTGPEGQQITDYRGSVPYNEIPRIHVEDGRSGHKGVDLIFSNISRTDRGKYTCSANVDGVEQERSFDLVVLKHLDFMDTPVTQFLEEDHDSVLRCDVDGDPAPRVSWHINNRKVNFGKKYEKGTEHPNDLIVRNATLEDAGQYKCVALQLSNYTSEVKDLVIEVKVHHKPQWSDNDLMAQAYGYVTGDVNLTCEAVAEPHANFTWIKDNQVIEPNETVQIINEDHKSVLRLKVTDVDMFGDYVCKAENKLGTLERVIILEEGKKPAVPSAKVRLK
ncbi:neural cell adhesion molecule 1-like [Penaeus indicus]|uniref:neural cell adhesion molecule 1-like n=1 Tax=Penaeus indicus TaxID=29960 RepID=UPI00300BFCE9